MKKRNLLIKVLILAFVSLSVINMPFNVMASSTGAVLSGTVESEVSILGEGTSGDITWKVDSNGVLWLTGNGDYVFLGNYKKLPWHDYSENITSAVMNIKGITNTDHIFAGCSNLKSLDLSSFDTSNVTDMSGMFYGCSNLIDLDLSNLDTSNVTNIRYMFYGCSNLKSLDLSSFDTSNVTDMNGMFYGCSNLIDLDLNNFDTSNVTDMEKMFYECNNLKSLNLSNFNTSNVISMMDMFYECSNLTSLDLSNFDTSDVVSMVDMFYECSNLTSLDLSNFDTSNVVSMNCMFGNCISLTDLDLNNFDTSNVTDMSSMFLDCENLKSLDLSSFDTSNVTSMVDMFYNCNNLTNLDLSSFDTSNVTSMTNMFISCSNLTILDLSSFDTSNVTSMANMFIFCNNLTKLHTPINVIKLVELPSSNNEKWYMDTTEVTHLPQNLNYSVTLVKATLTPDESETPAKVLIEDITISPSEISLKVGEKRTLSKSCTPSNADKQSVSWHSTEPDIASVDNQGTVIGVSEGTGQIYCVSQDGGNVESNYCTVEVVSDSDISTTEIPKAMKYVPYSFMLQDSIESSQDTSNYRITSGSLPAGMKIKSDGELYGVPEETGKFTFTVAMDNDNAISEKQQKVLQKLLSPVIYQYENKSIAARDFTEEDIIKFLSYLMNEEYYTTEDSNEFMIFGNYEKENYEKVFDKKDVFQRMNDIFGKAVNENLIAKDSCLNISGDKIKVTGADGAPVVDSKIMAYRKENKNLILSIHYKVEHNVSEFDREGNTTVVLVENEDSFIGYTLESIVPGEDYSGLTSIILQVIENTNANIEAMTDSGYELTERVPNLTQDTLTDQTMVSKGDYEEFVNLFLDSIKLERGVDYTAEPGSTRITIKSQTLKRFNTPGTHTLAMEFRTKNTNTLRWAAQNYVITGNGNSSNKGSLRGRRSHRASSNSQTNTVSQITYDSKKGYVHVLTGIITGEGTGYSRWIQDETGWKLNYADRTLARGSIQQLENGDSIEQIFWELINGSWYAFGADGSLKDGWVYDYQLSSWYCTSIENGMKEGWYLDPQDRYTYYLEPETGELAGGWKQINNQWYYFNPIAASQAWNLDESTGKWTYNTKSREKPYGAMYKNEQTPDGYYVNADGMWDGK